MLYVWLRRTTGTGDRLALAIEQYCTRRILMMT